MSVAETSVNLDADLPKYQLLFAIKRIGALARDFTQPHSPPPEIRL